MTTTGRKGETKTPGPTAYPETKVDGDKSMPTKRELPEDVYVNVPQGPCDMVKATLPEFQFPAMKRHITRQQRLSSEFPGIRWFSMSHRNLSTGGAVGNDLTQGNGRNTYVALERLALKECGIAYGTRVLWRRSLHSSPRTGEPSTWRRQAGVLDVTGK